MTQLNILYIGTDSGTCRHRAIALSRLGHQVRIVDPRSVLLKSQLLDHWMFRTGSLFLGGLINNRVERAIGSNGAFDLVWVDGGELIPPALVRELKRRFGAVINYNVDDPYGQRDGRRWRNYLACVPIYDLVVVVRECNVNEALRIGARRAVCVHRSADEVAHWPRALSAADRTKWASDIVFVGTWMPERGPFLARLLELGIPLSIYGERWRRAAEWPQLRRAWRGPGLHNDEEYATAIQCAKVCIGLLSKGNRDLCTSRSFEVPYLAGVLCAERTVEHLDLYKEDEEAAFWSTPEECAEKCLRLLQDAELRKRIGLAARARCIRNGTTNEAVLSRIIDAATNAAGRDDRAAEICLRVSS